MRHNLRFTSLLMFLAVFNLHNVISQTSGDFRTKGTGGDWNNTETWEIYDGDTWVNAASLPSSTNAISILPDDVVNIVSNSECGNLTISGNMIFGKSSTGEGAYTLNIVGDLSLVSGGSIIVFDAQKSNYHEILISGSLQNNGTVNTVSASNMDALYFNFNSTNNVFVMGNSITFSGLTINLNAGKTIDIQNIISISDPGSFGFRLFDLQNGIFKLSSASSFIAFSGASTIPSSAGFYLNHADANISWGNSGSLEVNGLLKIDAGTMAIGSSSGNKMDVNGSGAQFIMTGGTLNISGYWDQTSSGDAIVSGGIVNVQTKSSVTNSVDIVNIPSTCDFIMSGGEFNVKNLNKGAGKVLYINKGGNTSITGGTISISNLDKEPGVFAFYVDEELTLYNFNINIGNNAVLKDEVNNYIIENNFSISSGTLQIMPALSLTVNGNITNNSLNDGILIKSDANGTGSLIVNGTATGNITAERYMSGAEAWRLVSSPVAAHIISDVDNWTPVGGYLDGSGYDFYAYDEATATWLNQKVVANNITTFTPGKGYLVSMEAADQTKTFSGELNTGTVSIAISKSGSGDYTGANLIGNPYPSGIDWHSADRSLFADDKAYVYDRVSSEAGLSEGYKSVDGTNAGAYIAANQGFFVVAQTAGSFDFTNSMKVHNGTFYKEASSDLKLMVTNNSYFDETIISLFESSSFNRDRSDALKFYSNNANMPNFYTVSSDEKQLSVNSIPEINLSQPIKVGVTIPADGTYKINISEQGGSFENNIMFLEDLLTGNRHDLTNDGAYSFTASAGDSPDRFLLHFGVVGLGEQDAAATLNAYVYDKRLYVNSTLDQAQLAVYDLQGRLVMQQANKEQGLQTVPLNLPAGVYVVRLTNAKEARSVKINVQ